MWLNRLVDLPQALPSNYKRILLSGSTNSQTADTIDQMQQMVTLGKRQIEVRKVLQEFLTNCDPKDYYCYAEAAHLFCRDQIRYVFDPSGVELVESPARILETRVADCDSIVMLMATLCEQMGFACRFVTIKADKKRPDDYTHVFCEVKIPGYGWVGSDPTQPDKPFGWEPGPEYPRKNWPASNDGGEDHESDEMAGMNRLGRFGETIPGVQATPGVIVEKPWQWRSEPITMTPTPEMLELAPISQPGVPYSEVPAQDFYSADAAEKMFDTENAALCPVVANIPDYDYRSPSDLSGLGQLPAVPKWALVLGAAALLYFWMRKK